MYIIINLLQFFLPNVSVENFETGRYLAKI